jgi:hypothetical protein
MIKSSVAKDWIDWMLNEHIPEVMATGYFLDYKLLRTIIPSSTADEITYVINYSLKSIDDYYQYAEKFSGKFRASRSVLQSVD